MLVSGSLLNSLLLRSLGVRWSWMRTLQKPDDVKPEHVMLVYRLEKPNCKLGECESTCKISPRCLNGLSRLSQTEVCSDSGLSHPSSNSHCFRNGLKNYGSTCYLNAFLQLYFRFDKLRQSVFSLSNEVDDTGIVYQLQLVFSQLQLSNCGVVDPGGLIEALRLCEEEQQDAPEFHCLFMHLLESRFQEAGLTVVDDLLRGEYVHETRCLCCGFVSKQPSKFLELSLKVSSNTLQGCIRDHLREEPLTGENQYACPRCSQKRDGVRSTYITKAPSLLCIQFLRFTYDPRTSQRKKQKAAVRLPDVIELIEFDDESDDPTVEHPCLVKCLAHQYDTNRPRKYRLRGVLLHIGKQPTSGHYVAVVREFGSPNELQESSETRQGLEFWTVCNDMEVCTIPAEKFNLSKVNGSTKALQALLNSNTSKLPPETDDASTSLNGPNARRAVKSRGPQIKKRRQDVLNATAAEDSELSVCQSEPEVGDQEFFEGAAVNGTQESQRWYSSSNAYMVFYEVIDEQSAEPIVCIPDHLRQLIEDVNSSKRQELYAQQSARSNQLSALRELLQDIWPPDFNPESLTPDTLKSFSLVPTHWLKEWLSKPEQVAPDLPKQPEASGANVGTSNRPITCIFPVCEHGRVPIDLDSSTYRAVSTAGLRRRLADNISAPSPTESNEKLDQKLKCLQPCRDCICHKMALFQLEQAIRTLSKELDAFLRGKSVPLVPPATTETCSPPIESSEEQPMYYWVGRRSLRQWRSMARAYVSRMYATVQTPDQQKPPNTTFNSDALCSHGKLRYSSKHLRCIPAALWHSLVALFPAAETIPNFPAVPVTSQKCPDCEQLEQNVVERASRERQMLPNLLLPSSRRQLTPTLDRFPLVDESLLAHVVIRDCLSSRENQNNHLHEVDSMPSERASQPSSETTNEIRIPKSEQDISQPPRLAVYLVPTEFLNRWRRFVKNPQPETAPDHLPSGLNGTGVLCEHGKLTRPWWEMVSDSILSPLSTYEWNVFRQFYPSIGSMDCSNPQIDYSESDEDESTTGSNARIAYPDLFVLPSAESKEEWSLRPAEYASVCADCYAQLVAQRNSYKNARIRIRLVSGFEEAYTAWLLDPQSGEEVVVTETQNEPVTHFESTPRQLVTISEQDAPVEMSSRLPDTVPAEATFDGASQAESSFAHQNSKPCVEKHMGRRRSRTTKLEQPFVRRSNRQRLNPNDTVVYGSSDDSLQQIKVQLMQLIGVTPSDQHLFYRGVELSDHSKTLQDLNVYADSLLFLWTDSPVWTGGAENSSVYKASSTPESTSKAVALPRNTTCKPNIGPIELGFKGTRLLEN
ncbi:ubiquitin carboxyl-terminal hydrolase 48 [Clonorchis sinensis]|uniref:Ubiquitin carboxyl-terminal hydrolase 48 n=1 Tax=Clonorchis sinensis TaxID=79923 RepID=G7YN25_CLOSI|nr:ubiquitin carboxyl-terminal hydrolase 48 [Clonorchis sinensis]